MCSYSHSYSFSLTNENVPYQENFSIYKYSCVYFNSNSNIQILNKTIKKELLLAYKKGSPLKDLLYKCCTKLAIFIISYLSKGS